jgi:hypothetical protein
LTGDANGDANENAEPAFGLSAQADALRDKYNHTSELLQETQNGTTAATPTESQQSEESAYLSVNGERYSSVDEFAQVYSLVESELPLFIVGKPIHLQMPLVGGLNHLILQMPLIDGLHHLSLTPILCLVPLCPPPPFSLCRRCGARMDGSRDGSGYLERGSSDEAVRHFAHVHCQAFARLDG